MTAYNTSVGIITEKRLKTDHLLDLQYKMRLDKKNNWKLKIGVGYGVMNTGTGFTYPKIHDTLDVQGNLVYDMTDDTFLFWAPRFTLGTSFKKYNILFSIHKTKNQYNQEKASLWIETKLAYKL